METISAFVELINDKVLLEGSAQNRAPLRMDYKLPVGDDQGYTGLELLLVSLAGCSTTAILPMLRKQKKTIKAFNVSAKGERRDEHPTYLTKIYLEFTLDSPDTTAVELQRAIKLAEETYCPVWAMLKNSTEIITSFQIL